MKPQKRNEPLELHLSLKNDHPEALGSSLMTEAVAVTDSNHPGIFVTANQTRKGRRIVVEPIMPESAVGTSCRFCMYQSEAEDRFAYERFISSWYEQIHESPREGSEPLTAMRDVADAISH